MEELQYTMVPVADLKPNPQNPRKHPEKQIKSIMASIEEHGFLSPLLIDEHNVVIAGHGRLEAAKRLGRETVPCLIESHLTEAQRISYMIADNRLAELSSWDKPLVGTGLAKLAQLGGNIKLTGFGKAALPKNAAAMDLDEDAEPASAKRCEVIRCHCPNCGFDFEV